MNVAKVLRAILIGVVFLLYVYIVANMWLNDRVWPRGVDNVGMLLLAVVIGGVMMGVLYKMVKKMTVTKGKVALVFALVVVAQLVFGALFVTAPAWDFGCVHDIATASVQQSANVFEAEQTNCFEDYLYVYENNLGVTLLLRAVFGLANLVHFDHFVTVGILLNIVCIDVAIWYLYKLCELVFSKKTAFLFLLMSVVFTPFLLYVPIYYTDTLSMPFAVGAVYYFYRREYTKKGRKYDLVLASLLMGLGACIKITVLFVGIAMIVTYVVREKSEAVAAVLKKIVVIAVVACVPLALLNWYAGKMMDRGKVEALKVPYTHWVMMGMTGVGGFNEDDFNYTTSFGSVEEKKKANVEMIEARLRQHVEAGDLATFYTDKLMFTWGNGTLMGTVFLTEGTPKYQQPFAQFVYGDREMYLDYLAQAEWVLVLVGVVLGCVLRRYLRADQRDLQLMLCVLDFGLVAFFLVWEATSRYLLNMLPLILLTGYLGMQATRNWYVEKVLPRRLVAKRKEARR